MAEGKESMTVSREAPTDHVKEKKEREMMSFAGAQSGFKKDGDTTTSTLSLPSSARTSHRLEDESHIERSEKECQTRVKLQQQEAIEKQNSNVTHSVTSSAGCDSGCYSEKELQSEQIGTTVGCKQKWPHPATLCCKTGYKREENSHSPNDRNENLSTVSAISSHVAERYPESVKNREATTDPHQRAEVRQPSKRIKLETATGKAKCTIPTNTGEQSQPPPNMEPGANHHTCPLPNALQSSACNSEAETVAETIAAASTRSMSLPGGPCSSKRPITLHVAAQPAVVHAAHNIHIHHVDAAFVEGEEEMTPDGGRREFVSHNYRCPLMNNGEKVVTPDVSPSPPNMVVGYIFPLEPYRRQFSDNSHTMQDGAPCQAIRRQNSEPPRLCREHYIDNNGREVFRDHNL